MIIVIIIIMISDNDNDYVYICLECLFPCATSIYSLNNFKISLRHIFHVSADG